MFVSLLSLCNKIKNIIKKMYLLPEVKVITIMVEKGFNGSNGDDNKGGIIAPGWGTIG